MNRVQKSLVLLLVAGIPAAAPPLDPGAADLCVASGDMTYRLARANGSADLRIRIDNASPAPDLRIAIIDRAELADFAFADDDGQTGDACRNLGPRKTVALATGGKAADLVVGFTPDPAHADATLYVQSARLAHDDAAALFALMRQAAPASIVAAR